MADEINWCPECAGVVYDPTCAICGGQGKLPEAARGEVPDGEGGEKQGEGQGNKVETPAGLEPAHIRIRIDRSAN